MMTIVELTAPIFHEPTSATIYATYHKKIELSDKHGTQGITSEPLTASSE